MLNAAGAPFLVGGAYALERYTGIVRHTKDLDLFVRPSDVDDVLQLLRDHGSRTEMPFPHWLAKAYAPSGRAFVDVIFGSGNGLAMVDDAWFRHAVTTSIHGVVTRLVPPEEMIWSKAFIMERERFDGADVMHMLRACAEQLDWPRLVGRFGRRWRVLLAHLVLFGFVYPGERARVPGDVLRALVARLADELDRDPEDQDDPRVCQGTLLSRQQYLHDVNHGLDDARTRDDVGLSAEDVAAWTAGIGADEGSKPA